MNKDYKFIKDAYEGKHGSISKELKDTILKHYPEFKEEEFKVEDWIFPCWDVKCPRPHRINRITSTHYITDPWLDSELNTIGFNKEDKYRKATKEEILSYLSKEADKRGYRPSVRIV